MTVESLAMSTVKLLADQVKLFNSSQIAEIFIRNQIAIAILR